ncbi:MAG: hypothetical protein Tsb0021_01190 [Chlamydiales bacterium]
MLYSTSKTLKNWTILGASLILLATQSLTSESVPFFKERMTDQEIEAHPILRHWKIEDRGHFKTFFKCTNNFEPPISVSMFRPLKDEKHAFREYTIDREFYNWMKEAMDKPILGAITSKGFLPGEVIQIVAYDGKMRLIGNDYITPLPLEKTSLIDGATISFQLKTTEPEFYFINFEGFGETEIVHMKSESLHETMASSLTDRFRLVSYSPNVKGHKEGTAKVTFTREDGERIVFEVPWGESLHKYRMGEVEAFTAQNEG